MSMSRPKNHWGPSLWAFIHTITIVDYDRNRIYNENIIKNLKSLTDAIPCEKCQTKYRNALLDLDILDLNESNVLFKWSVDLHNKVNQQLNKPSMTYEDALKIWGRQFV
jgi:hypothetical protein